MFPDYNAPLSEAGGYTDKYYSAITMIEQQDPLSDVIVRYREN